MSPFTPPAETRMLGCGLLLGCLAFAAFVLVLPWLLF